MPRRGIGNIAKIAKIAKIISNPGENSFGACDAPHNSMEDKPSAAALKNRTKRFALDVIVLCKHFPRTLAAYIVAKQLIRAATGTAANYRAACRARSATEFASRISVVTEEADESEFWLEIAIEADIMSDQLARKLLVEAGELTAIFTASRETAKRNLVQRRQQSGNAALRLCLVLAMFAMLAIHAPT